MEQKPAKPFVVSKTVIVQSLGLVALLFPKSREFINTHATETGAMWAVLNIVLRFVSSGRVVIW